MDILLRILVVAIVLAEPLPALAQGLKAILEQADEGDAELKQIDTALTHPDPDKRISALNAIMSSGVDRYTDKALDVALLSDDPRLREAALQAAIVEGATFRVEVDLAGSNKEATDAAGWLRSSGGTVTTDGKTGFAIVPVGKFYEPSSCWVHLNWNSCAFRLAGEQVFYSSRNNTEAQLMLDESGNLVGSLLVGGMGNPVPVVIHLTD